MQEKTIAYASEQMRPCADNSPFGPFSASAVAVPATISNPSCEKMPRLAELHAAIIQRVVDFGELDGRLLDDELIDVNVWRSRGVRSSNRHPDLTPRPTDAQIKPGPQKQVDQRRLSTDPQAAAMGRNHA